MKRPIYITEDVATQSQESLTTPDVVSTTPPMVHGDWVLFHPVYTSAELRAVQVRTHKSRYVRGSSITTLFIR